MPPENPVAPIISYNNRLVNYTAFELSINISRKLKLALFAQSDIIYAMNLILLLTKRETELCL